jgi:hypothetical protein
MNAVLVLFHFLIPFSLTVPKPLIQPRRAKRSDNAIHPSFSRLLHASISIKASPHERMKTQQQ